MAQKKRSNKYPCPACRRKIAKSNHHCPYCGLPLDEEANDAGSYTATVPRRHGFVKAKKKIGNILWPLVIVAIFAIVILVGMEACDKADLTEQGKEWFDDQLPKEE